MLSGPTGDHTASAVRCVDARVSDGLALLLYVTLRPGVRRYQRPQRFARHP